MSEPREPQVTSADHEEAVFYGHIAPNGDYVGEGRGPGWGETGRTTDNQNDNK